MAQTLESLAVSQLVLGQEQRVVRFLQGGALKPQNGTDQIFTTQILFKYSLLDQLTAAMEIPRHPSFRPRHRRAYPEKVPQRLTGLLGDLNPWEGPLLSLQKAMEHREAPKQPDTPFANSLNQPLNARQRLFAGSLTGLYRAGKHAGEARLNSVHLNIELMCFMIGWQASVRPLLLIHSRLISFVNVLYLYP